MNRLHGNLGSLGLVAASLVACVAESKEISATAASAESGTGEESGETGDSASSTSVSTTAMTSDVTTSEPTTGPMTATDPTNGEATTMAESTTGEPGMCEDAQTQAACEGVANDFETCGWVPTVVVAGGSCEPVDTGFEGQCVLLEQADGCTGPGDATCPDGVTRVYYSALGLEIGAVELMVIESQSCEESGAGFEPCVMIDGDPVSFDPPECACACPG